jgi:hypothetical protein
LVDLKALTLPADKEVKAEATAGGIRAMAFLTRFS